MDFALNLVYPERARKKEKRLKNKGLNLPRRYEPRILAE
jgi:hypothetical protein